MANASDPAGPNVEQLLAGILAMLVAQREDVLLDPKDRPKTEVVLSSVGYQAPAIARLLGKNVDAVRKTIQRAR